MAQAQKLTLPGNVKASSRSLWQRIKQARWAYTFISPFYILFAVFGLYPMLLSLYLSFTRWKGVGPIEFAGLVNFGLILKDKVRSEERRVGKEGKRWRVVVR